MNARMRTLLCLALPTLLLTAAAASCSSKQTVVVYSPHGPEVLNDYKTRFEAAYPEIEVLTFDMGSNDVYNRISAERNRPAADVWWGAPSTMFMQAAKEGLLEPYQPSWTSASDSSARDSQDRWYGTYKSPLAIVYNTRHYSRETAPQSWDELLDPKWRGKIAIRKPLASGTMRSFIGAMILRASNEDAGIAWLKTLHEATDAYLESPQLLFDHLKRNEDKISVWLMPDVLLQREQNGYTVDCIVPSQTPVLTEAIAIVKGAPHPDWAKKFYEFVTRPEELAHQAEKFSKMPARTNIDPKTLPSWMAEAKFDVLPVDWNVFAEKEQAWCDRWEKEVYQQQ